MHRREAGNLSCVEVTLFGVLGHHAVAGNVDERQHARGRAIYRRRAKALNVAPAGASGVDHGRHAGSEGEAVRPHAGVSDPGACDPDRREEVGHQTLKDVQPGDAEREPRFTGLDSCLHRDDAATRPCHVVRLRSGPTPGRWLIRRAVPDRATGRRGPQGRLPPVPAQPGNSRASPCEDKP